MRPKTRYQIEQRYEVDQIFQDSDGWWVWLKPGYWSSNMECGTIHEMTIKECCEQMVYVERAPKDVVERSGHSWEEVKSIYQHEPARMD